MSEDDRRNRYDCALCGSTEWPGIIREGNGRFYDLEERAIESQAALEHIAYAIDTTEPSGAFADDAASNPPIGLTDEEAWQIMRSVARAALGKISERTP